jgi:hypothetical protein
MGKLSFSFDKEMLESVIPDLSVIVVTSIGKCIMIVDFSNFIFCDLYP